MRRPESAFAAALVSLLLAGCATSALDMAPSRPDRPWVPATRDNGEIVPGKQQDSASAGKSAYVLPANQALAGIPQQPQLDPAHVYTLPELIDIAQSNSPATRIAWDTARNAALASGIVESAYLPNLSASVVGGYQSVHNENNAFGLSGANDTSVTGVVSALSLQWLLFDFGERSALLDASRQGSVISNIAFTAAHQKVIYDVSLAFYANAAAKARVGFADESLKNAEAVQAAAEDRYKQGIGTVVEVDQARQITAQARLAQVQARGSAQDSQLALLSAMGVPPLTAIQVEDIADRKLSPDVTGQVDSIVAGALSRRPDMLGAYAAKQASLANLKAAKAEFLPKVFLSATGAYVSNGLGVTTLPGLGQQPSTVNLSGNELGGTILLGVTIPLYDGGNRLALLEQARTRADSADATLAQVRDEAMREVVKAQNGLNTSLAAYEASQALTGAAQTTFDAALDAYRNGVGSITDVTTAETQLLQAKSALTDAHSAALSAAATLAFAVGTLGSSPE
jgi:outer membrane protein